MRRLWSHIILAATSLVMVGATFATVVTNIDSNIEYSSGRELVFRVAEKGEDGNPDETITFEEKIKSKDFDVVKVYATTHTYGVSAEYKWLKHNYPSYDKTMQSLCQITLDDGEKVIFDKMDISKNKKGKSIHKTIWFDITDFIIGASVPFRGESDAYAVNTIKGLYRK